ncbi:cyclophilin-like fold protein [Sphingopyxis sp.]|uniref:cyclophilin-like fold protein n=1 Tax=Sphingopyxis sp. TaxID=1908224 RepID=UPI002B495B55|nr:cyclophilin-like fold protein [Sphingopyxis sp.]HJS10020.1 cyclophilin-like fold protein [Sphingopyxis sp.]
MAALAALVSACTGPASDANVSAQEQSRSQQRTEEPMKIRIVTADRTLTAVLDDHAAARDFAALLPIELTLSDYNRTEKIADLPRRLSVEEAPDGIKPSAGDIAYYAPWGNLAIFYRDFGYSRGLVRLGRLEGGTDALEKLDEGRVRIERIP